MNSTGFRENRARPSMIKFLQIINIFNLSLASCSDTPLTRSEPKQAPILLEKSTRNETKTEASSELKQEFSVISYRMIRVAKLQISGEFLKTCALKNGCSVTCGQCLCILELLAFSLN